MVRILHKLQAAASRVAAGAVLLFIACLIALAAAGFAIAALYKVLSHPFAPETAAAITAVILLVIAGVIALIASAVMKAPKNERRAPDGGPHRTGSLEQERLRGLAMMQQVVAGGRWSTLAMALIAGFAFGISPEVRREAARLFRREVERR